MLQTRFDFSNKIKYYLKQVATPVVGIPVGIGILVYCFTGILKLSIYGIALYGTLSILVYLIPFLVIYCNHSRYNKHSVFEIVNQGKQGVYNYTDKNQEITFTDDDIEKAEVILSTQFFRKRSRQLPWHKIFFTVFTLKNGSRIVISSLIFEDISYLHSTTIHFPKTGFTRSWPLIKSHKTIPLMK